MERGGIEGERGVEKNGDGVRWMSRGGEVVWCVNMGGGWWKGK